MRLSPLSRNCGAQFVAAALAHMGCLPLFSSTRFDGGGMNKFHLLAITIERH